MRPYFVSLLFLSINLLSAQKLVKKSVLSSKTTSININTENCFKVEMETGKNKEILVQAKMAGEYQNNLILRIYEKGTTVFISAGFSPDFKKPNDKLSAHKVVSISLKIILPEYQNVNIFGKSSGIIATGIYENLNIALSDGFCRLQNIVGETVAKTQSGNIYIKGALGKINASSKYGQVKSISVPKGANIYNLSSITGDVHVL